MYLKFTEGYVSQCFDRNGRCISQHFHAGDIVSYEDAKTGEPCEAIDAYFPFYMVQPDASP